MNYSHCRGCGRSMGGNTDERLFCSRDCNPAVRRAAKQRTTAARRGRGLRASRKHQHGLDDKQWVALVGDDPQCHACGTREFGSKGLMVDHDHLCCPGPFGCPQCIRGILCQGCNSALGYLKDDYERIMGLARYLYRDQAVPLPRSPRSTQLADRGGI